MNLKVTGWIIITMTLSSCTSTPQEVNQYQIEPVSTRSDSGPVVELQRKAVSALASNQTKASIQFLQRAIKIEPRNAFSWHYLAKSYLQDKNFEKCLDMIERSRSYSNPVDKLDRANEQIKKQCQNGL